MDTLILNRKGISKFNTFLDGQKAHSTDPLVKSLREKRIRIRFADNDSFVDSTFRRRQNLSLLYAGRTTYSWRR